MAKERLSLLQYYILSRLCEAENNCIGRAEIYEFFGNDEPSTRVIVCRSLRRLKEKGFIHYMPHSKILKIWLN